MDRCSRLRVAGDFGGQLTQTGYGHNSRHNDRIVVKPGQNVRLVSAKLPVKYQRDSYDIKKVSPRPSVHGSTPAPATGLGGITHTDTRLSNFRPNDRIVIKLGQKLRLVSANIPVEFQLDCFKIKEKVGMACVDDTRFSRPDLPTHRPNSPRIDRIVVKLGQCVRLVSAKPPVKFQLDR